MECMLNRVFADGGKKNGRIMRNVGEEPKDFLFGVSGEKGCADLLFESNAART